MFGSKKTAPSKAPLPNIEGHRVLYVNPKGPGTKAGLIPYFVSMISRWRVVFIFYVERS